MRKETSHILHGIMTLLFLPWGVIWIACHMKTKEDNRQMGYYD